MNAELFSKARIYEKNLQVLVGVGGWTYQSD